VYFVPEARPPRHFRVFSENCGNFFELVPFPSLPSVLPSTDVRCGPGTSRCPPLTCPPRSLCDNRTPSPGFFYPYLLHIKSLPRFARRCWFPPSLRLSGLLFLRARFWFRFSHKVPFATNSRVSDPPPRQQRLSCDVRALMRGPQRPFLVPALATFSAPTSVLKFLPLYLIVRTCRLTTALASLRV